MSGRGSDRAAVHGVRQHVTEGDGLGAHGGHDLVERGAEHGPGSLGALLAELADGVDAVKAGADAGDEPELLVQRRQRDLKPPQTLLADLLEGGLAAQRLDARRSSESANARYHGSTASLGRKLAIPGWWRIARSAIAILPIDARDENSTVPGGRSLAELSLSPSSVMV